MPELPAVVPGELIEAGTFGNPVLDRSVQRYTSATDRDGLIPTPVAGQLAYLGDVGVITYYDGSTWQEVVRVQTPGLADYVPLSGGVMSGSLTAVRYYATADGGQGSPVFGWAQPGGASGMYRLTAGGLRWTVNDIWRAELNETYLRSIVPILAPQGSESAPELSFWGDEDTGFWRSGANNLELVTGGTSRLKLVNSAQHTINGGPLRAIHSGTSAPLDSLGVDGDLYVQR